jgi:hypothetical protein
VLGFMKKLRGGVENKLDFGFWKIQKGLTGLVGKVQFLFRLGFPCISLIPWFSKTLRL